MAVLARIAMLLEDSTAVVQQAELAAPTLAAELPQEVERLTLEELPVRLATV